MGNLLAIIVGFFLCGVGAGAWTYGEVSSYSEALPWIVLGIALITIGTVGAIREERRGQP